MPSLASEPLLAAHFVGVVLAMIFYGITLGQAYAYYRTYMTDPRHMRLIVALLRFLDTFQVFLAFTSIYDYTIRLRGDESALQYVSRPFSASMAVTSVVAFTVQMIYAYRVWRCLYFAFVANLSITCRAVSAGNAYLTTSIVSLAFIALGSGTAMTVKTIRNPRWDETRVSNLAAGIILASTVTCDLLIASAQVWLFHRHRLKDGKLFSFALGRRREPMASAPLSPVAATEEGTRSSTAEPPTPRGGSRRGSLLTGITSLAGSWRVGSGPASTVATAEADKEEQQGCVNDGDQDGCRLGALLTTLTVLVVNVGLLTSLDATAFLVLFLVCPSNGTFLVPYILLSNCYVNSFLSILNSRRILRDLVENPEHFPVTFDFALNIDTG
ncbi:hypothetical protein DFH08DRAFT_1071582 [Mycena albidolilacea]|uniref:DUF6534 domain-containing protein n=1 Tax=Mycena albidolilacea TaxID=1033008 RepID=A0AAD7F7D3_9AGAR|nr:hypothetical protein DFH08DRAFT_1071582 [Mycena albidolilacea]